MTQWDREEYVKGRKVRTHSHAHGREHGHTSGARRSAWVAWTVDAALFVTSGEWRAADDRLRGVGWCVEGDDDSMKVGCHFDGPYCFVAASGVRNVMDMDGAWTGCGRDADADESEGRLDSGGRGRDDDQLVTLALGRPARRGVLHQTWHEPGDGSGRLERAGL
eukprot:CAMPEP_0119523980 /NCGR_PEP_ID=MMETSP1344-20130328/38966_1 /TAXON_ID=236787 /ORGANISM="Florenciella parvula, Strain CCMP2471" /LENGTH=163 /DNA_ID=CAMNT_0007562367 /DNA_START=9 /DNA_END=502 /DNA_ORIENTATION=+